MGEGFCEGYSSKVSVKLCGVRFLTPNISSSICPSNGLTNGGISHWPISCGVINKINYFYFKIVQTVVN